MQNFLKIKKTNRKTAYASNNLKTIINRDNFYLNQG